MFIDSSIYYYYNYYYLLYNIINEFRHFTIELGWIEFII